MYLYSEFIVIYDKSLWLNLKYQASITCHCHEGLITRSEESLTDFKKIYRPMYRYRESCTPKYRYQSGSILNTSTVPRPEYTVVVSSHFKKAFVQNTETPSRSVIQSQSLYTYIRWSCRERFQHKSFQVKWFQTSTRISMKHLWYFLGGKLDKQYKIIRDMIFCYHCLVNMW